MIYKTKRIQELREMSSMDLKNRIQEINESQLILRTAKENKHGVNPGQWRNLKKEKARILTILGERVNPGKGGFRKHEN